jgi:hypothetical protein
MQWLWCAMGSFSSQLLLCLTKISKRISEVPFPTVDDFVAVEAPDFNKDQQSSTSGLQQVQQQSLRINGILQISTSSRI